MRCAEFVHAVYQGDFVVVLDDHWHILKEYHNKIPNQPEGSLSHKFLRHVLSHQGNPSRVRQVSITPLRDQDFEEFPQSLREVEFDMSDRKFVAVAIANERNAPIM
jgi:hypothetical protein